MILNLGRDSFYRYSFLLCLPGDVSKSAFLQRAKVEANSYAGDLIAGLHDAIFRCSLELKRDFSEYYSLEYGTFIAYLRKRLRLSPEIVNRVEAEWSRSNKVIHFHPIYCFLEDEYGVEFLQRLLEPEKAK